MRKTNVGSRPPSCFKMKGIMCFDENCIWRDQCKPATSIEEMKGKKRGDRG